MVPFDYRTTHEILTMSGAEVPTGASTLAHDVKGNMTTDERGCHLQWDFDNMLTAFSANGVTDRNDANYTYDAIGRRISKAVAESGGSETTIFTRAGQQVVCEYAPASPVTDTERKFTYGSYIDEPLLFVDATTTAETLYYFHRNRQFSTYAVTSATSLTLQHYRYDLCGKHKTISPNGSSLGVDLLGNHGVTFTGRNFDRESGMIYLRSREMNTTVGAFSNRDSDGYVDGMSLYRAYFSTKGVDPSGNSICTTGVCSQINGDYFHYGCHCGELRPSDKPSAVPIDSVDGACKGHDLCWGAIANPPCKPVHWLNGPDPNPKCRACDRAFCRSLKISNCNRYTDGSVERGRCEAFRCNAMITFRCENFGINPGTDSRCLKYQGQWPNDADGSELTK